MPYTIDRKYHFHAAHRNEYLTGDKCFNIHGHTYHVTITFKFTKKGKGGITMLFSELDEAVGKLIRALDHSFIIHRADPLYEVLKGHTRLYVLEEPSSAENLSKHIFNELHNKYLPVFSVKLQETTSAIVEYCI